MTSTCERLVSEAVSRDASLSSLLTRIRASRVGRSLVLRCQEPHGEGEGDGRVTRARAFFQADALGDANARDPEVVVVMGRVHGLDEVREVLRHELVHAFDHCVRERDLTRVEELCCSEIRAHAVAECSRENTWPCHQLGVDPTSSMCAWIRARCVERRARVAVGNVFPGDGKVRDAVRGMMPTCFSPYDEDLPPAAPEQRGGASHT